MRQRARVDKNQTEIVSGLRKTGCSVVCLHTIGAGCPDLLVGYNGQNWLIELKDKKGTLTPAQVGFHASWLGSVYVVRSLEEAIDIVFGKKERGS